MQLTISVVTPSLNQGRFINRTIQSVLAQGISGLEYIVIDGGSKDKTLDILRRYEGQLRWVSEKDNGQAGAVNKGVTATRGDIIGWINSDDIYYPGALAAALSFFEKHPEVEIIYGDANFIDIHDKVIEPYYTKDWNYEKLKGICFICQPAVFFRRRLTEKVGLLDERLHYCMDYEYWLRLGAKTPFIRLHKKLAGSRMYPENKTLESRIAVIHETNHMLQKKLGRVPLKWVLSYAHVVAVQKIYDSKNPRQNMRYLYFLVIESIRSLAKWRWTSSGQDVRSIVGWALKSLKGLCKRSAAKG